MQQLSLDLGIVPQTSQTTTYDSYWDEITQPDKGVGGQRATIQVGSRVRDTWSIRPHDKEGEILQVHSTWCVVLWDGWVHPSNHCLSDLELAPQQLSPCETVGGQVNNDTDNSAPQQVFTGKSVGGQVNNNTNYSAPQHNGWVEKYSVNRSGTKYYYWRFVWREGTKKRRRYIGSCTNPKARERVGMVKDAIALGRTVGEVIGLL